MWKNIQAKSAPKLHLESVEQVSAFATGFVGRNFFACLQTSLSSLLLFSVLIPVPDNTSFSYFSLRSAKSSLLGKSSSPDANLAQKGNSQMFQKTGFIKLKSMGRLHLRSWIVRWLMISVRYIWTKLNLEIVWGIVQWSALEFVGRTMDFMNFGTQLQIKRTILISSLQMQVTMIMNSKWNHNLKSIYKIAILVPWVSSD